MTQNGQNGKIKWTRKDLLGLRDLSAEEIELILDTAKSFSEVSQREVKKVPALRGKTVVNLFLEPSTRTRVSFELAEKRLSADTISMASAGSSMSKGESLWDTIANIEALKVDLIVMRHGSSGAPHRISTYTRCGLVNAGDGINEHPTQGLLDMFTLRELKGKIKGLKVVFVGDILHSRVARSNVWGLTKLGAEVVICGPKTLIPWGIEELGVKVVHDVKKAIDGADAVTLLRIQMERQNETLFPSIREYASTFGLKTELFKLAKPDAILMHPGPINRGVEIESALADSPQSYILKQVTNGIAVRMAVLYLLSGVIKNEK
ncbi:MAG TPA: aspartate carbamoyltransferase catalytic subunit [Candidatus Omnitrophota bacterium]|nr:aspartate carbamoyltransferase catalytic subunit [Candidatus Omnitrophota bacterium]HPS36501.1 aspartate carbamoyltransferase catalytic subunit [Candidatus Omnitrophota bacterium]